MPKKPKESLPESMKRVQQQIQEKLKKAPKKYYAPRTKSDPGARRG